MENTISQNKLELYELQVMYNSGENTTPEVLKRIKMLERIISLQECSNVDDFIHTLAKPHLS